MDKQCYEPLAAGGGRVAVCILPEGHEGDHDGGATERLIAEECFAQVLQERQEWEESHG